MTAGRVLAYRGRPAEVFYSASCGGRSEAAEHVWPAARLPYLESVADDVHADDRPWTLTLTLRDVQRVLSRAGFRGERLRDVRIAGRHESGRVSQLTLDGLNPSTITGERFRAAIGPGVLRSTAFSLSRGEGVLEFVGRGYGHGVGMCVIGAGRRARRGESAEDILAQYYPGLTLISAPASTQ